MSICKKASLGSKTEKYRKRASQRQSPIGSARGYDAEKVAGLIGRVSRHSQS